MSRRRRATGAGNISITKYFNDSRESPRFYVFVEPDIHEAFKSFCIGNDFPSQNQAVNYLMRIALSSVPDLGAIQAERIRASNEVRHWAYERLKFFFGELQQQIALSAPTAAPPRETPADSGGIF